MRTYSIQGGEVAVWEWPGAGRPILLCHATGFHGRCWDQVVRGLPGRQVFALDFPGHGRSGPIEPPCRWRPFGETLAALTAAMDLRGAIGVGHSMGGHSLTIAAARNPSAFVGLLLLDPTVVAPSVYTGPGAPIDFVLRRRDSWESPAQIVERFATRDPFRKWDPAVLRDYAAFALNGSALACPPAVEASIYSQMSDPGADPSPEIAQIAAPVWVVRSGIPYQEGRFDSSPTDPALAARFAHGTDVPRPDLTHFIPMEDPAGTARLILEFDSRIS